MDEDYATCIYCGIGITDGRNCCRECKMNEVREVGGLTARLNNIEDSLGEILELLKKEVEDET